MYDTYNRYTRTKDCAYLYSTQQGGGNVTRMSEYE